MREDIKNIKGTEQKKSTNTQRNTNSQRSTNSEKDANAGRNRIMKHLLAASLTVAGCLLCGGMAAGTVIGNFETEQEGETDWETELITGDIPGIWEDWEEVRGSETETETMSETDSEQPGEPDSEMILETESEPPEESDSEMILETENEQVSETVTEEEKETESGQISETVTEAEMETESEQPGEPDSEKMPETESEQVSETVTEEETETESGQISETVTEAEMETEIKTEMETDSEQISEAVMEEETESEQISETVSEPEQIIRGIHYIITGEEGAYWRDDNDCLWIRKGTGVSVQPVGGSGYDQGINLIKTEQDGSLEFCLRKTDGAGAVLQTSAAASELYFVDGEAPKAVINVEGINKNGIVYTASEAAVHLMLEPDGKSGLKKAAYCIIPCNPDGTWQSRPEECVWYECGLNQAVTTSEEGVFQIYVRTEDQVGNLTFSVSLPFCVDRTSPELTVEGVQDQTANNGQVVIRIVCRDVNYLEESLTVSVTGVNQGKMPMVQSRKEQEEGTDVLYYDFPVEKAYDDIYQMTITAEDKAGNKTEESMRFSINRFGSVYDLSEQTKELLSQFYLAEPEDIVFCETNIDYVGASEIYCRCDGIMQVLESGQDYKVVMQGEEDTWKQYQYTIPADYFRQEGVYELLLTSGDEASNVSDTGMQEKRVVFALDKTVPGCTLSGISSGQVYEKDQMTIFVTPYDNMALSTVRVYCNTQVILEEKNLKTDQTLQVELQEKEEWQTLQIYVSDLAGNEYWTEEVPVYINLKTEEVPEYQKPELSAKESEQMKNGTESALHEKEEADPEQREIQTDAGNPNLRSDRQSNTQEESGKKERTSLFWPLGPVVFLLTIVICRVAGSRWKH